MADATHPPELAPQQRELRSTDPPGMPMGGWYVNHYVTDVPQETAQWMFAQGWRQEAVRYDTTMTPPVPYYTLTRNSLMTEVVMQTLLNEYNWFDDQARAFNDFRYNDVVQNWSSLSDSTQDYFDTQFSVQDDHFTAFLGNLDTYMDAVDTLIATNAAKIAEDAVAAQAALEVMNDKLADLEGNFGDHKTIIDGLLGERIGYLDVFTDPQDGFAAKLAILDTNFTDYLDNVMSALLQDSDDDVQAFLKAHTPQLTALAKSYNAEATALNDILGPISQDSDTAATAINNILDNLENEYDTLLEKIEPYLTSSNTALETFVTAFETTRDALDTDYSSVAGELDGIRSTSDGLLNVHSTTYGGLLDGLDGDYSDHANTASGLLDGLGSTELARITEEFSSRLSEQVQHLIDTGMYASDEVADITERNARDRDEQVQALNDRLNRERLENQHQLFGQQQSMRDRVLAGKDRLHGVQQEVHREHVGQITSRFGLQQSARDRVMAANERLHAVKQGVYQYQVQQWTGVYGLLQSIRDRTMSGRQAIYNLKDTNARFRAELSQKVEEARIQLSRLLIDEAARVQALEQSITVWKAGQREKLHAELQDIVMKRAAAMQTLHGIEQDVTQALASAYDTLHGQLQGAVRGFIEGKERFSAMWMQAASTLADHRHKIVLEMMNAAVARLEGEKYEHAENMKLMAYQLDTRNQVLIGLYGFVERREDIGPKFEQLTQICTALGDTGGGWVTP